LNNRRKDERGVSLILVAISMVLFIAAGALSVDLGRTVVLNRSLQSVADVAALDAARYINVSGENLTTQADRAATDNNSSATMTASEGLWSGGVFTAYTPSQCIPTVPPAHAACNAVKVTATATLAHLFEPGNSTQSRSAIASVNPESGFSIGTYLASFSTEQSGVLNPLLGALGTSVNLTAVGYDGLANTDVTVQQLINASGGVLTPTNVLSTSLTGAQWDSFLNTAVESQTALLSCGASPTPYPCTANTSLTTLSNSINTSTSASLCQLVSINGSTCSGGELSQAALSANINVLQTLTTEAELANGTNALNVTAALNLGITSAKLYTTLIQVPQVAYGPVGTTASTSQVNISLQLSIAGVGLLVIPITGADGTATLQTITCSDNVMTNTKINASTTAATLDVSLLGTTISTATVSGATATLGYTVAPPTTATITASPPTNPITVGTENPSLSFTSVGLLGLVEDLLVNPVLSTLGGSNVLGPVLQALGVNLAGAQVADLSTDCGSVSLVQ
jgi:uncharacterized membrane protein